MAEQLANLAKGDEVGKWKLLGTKSGAQQTISFAGIDYDELMIVARGYGNDNTAYSHASWRLSKEEINLIGVNESAWYAQGGYMNASFSAFANFGIYGNKSVRTNVFYGNGTPLNGLTWYVYYR